MVNLAYKSVLLVAVVCVLVVFVAPTIDLPETALRAKQNAHNVMICITLLAIQFLFVIVLILFRSERENPISRFSARTNPLLCTFLC
jgi:NADH:ubiquinone oxidoreductase subunit 6 (subunit J)